MASLVQRMARGFSYLFAEVPVPTSQDTARRSVPLQFQTYPLNEVQGAGTLIHTGGRVGNYFRITAPQDYVQPLAPVTSDITGGGTPAGGLLMVPLVDTSGSMG